MPANVVEVYMSLPKAILKADLFRYIAVMVLGGVYSDEDTECLHPVDMWTDDHHRHVKFILGLEWDKPANWKGFARPLQFCQWTFAGVSNHPILQNVVNKIVAVSPKMLDQNMSYDLVMNWTGPGIWSDVILDYLHDHHKVNALHLFTNLKHPVLIGDLYILPQNAFGIYHRREGKQQPDTHVRHRFQGSWKKDKDTRRKRSR